MAPLVLQIAPQRASTKFRHVCGAECRVADVVGVDGVRATSDVEVAHDVSAEIAHGCRDEALGAPALGDERGWCGWEDAEDGVGVVGLTAAGRCVVTRRRSKIEL